MIITFGDSRTGLIRKLNEDAISFNDKHLFVLADGMGGYEGGQIASTSAVNSVNQFFEKEKKEFSEDTLAQSVLYANQMILELKTTKTELSSMGTTLIVAAVKKNRFYWAHVGDSRLYIWHDKELKQITTDHSFVMELVSEGKISKEEMRVHPRKNEITRAVGIENDLKVDSGSGPLQDGSLLLICSDGLTGMLNDEEINEMISQSPRKTFDDLKNLGNQLMDAVYKAGAKDNVSLILIQFWNVEN